MNKRNLLAPAVSPSLLLNSRYSDNFFGAGDKSVPYSLFLVNLAVIQLKHYNIISNGRQNLASHLNAKLGTNVNEEI